MEKPHIKLHEKEIGKGWLYTSSGKSCLMGHVIEAKHPKLLKEIYDEHSFLYGVKYGVNFGNLPVEIQNEFCLAEYTSVASLNDSGFFKEAAAIANEAFDVEIEILED